MGQTFFLFGSLLPFPNQTLPQIPETNGIKQAFRNNYNFFNKRLQKDKDSIFLKKKTNKKATIQSNRNQQT